MKITVVLERPIAAVELAQSLRQKAGLEADVRIAHVPFQLAARHQGRHAVHDYHVHCAAAHQVLHDFEGLLGIVRLGQIERVYVDAAARRIALVQRVLGIYVSGGAALALGLRRDVIGERGLARRLGAEYLDNAAPGHASHSQRYVQ